MRDRTLQGESAITDSLGSQWRAEGPPSTLCSRSLAIQRTAGADPTEPPENGEADPESSQSLALVNSGSAPFEALTPDPDSALHYFDWPRRGADSLCQPGARPCSPALLPNPLAAPAAEFACAIGRKFRR